MHPYLRVEEQHHPLALVVIEANNLELPVHNSGSSELGRRGANLAL